MKISVVILPEEIISRYNLLQLTSNGWLYLEIRKGMTGLKQAGCIANDTLKIHLAKFGYSPFSQTPSLWKNSTKDICFSIVVDDFGVNYVGKDTADHLIQRLKKLYTISINWTGSLYCGLAIIWDYDKSLAILPKEIIAQYNLLQLASDIWVYLEIRKGVPGLKQAGCIANDRLKIHIAKFGYSPVI